MQRQNYYSSCSSRSLLVRELKASPQAGGGGLHLADRLCFWGADCSKGEFVEASCRLQAPCVLGARMRLLMLAVGPYRMPRSVVAVAVCWRFDSVFCHRLPCAHAGQSGFSVNMLDDIVARSLFLFSRLLPSDWHWHQK